MVLWRGLLVLESAGATVYFCRTASLARPLKHALLVSATVHVVLISFMVTNSGLGAGKSDVVARVLPVLSVSVTRAGKALVAPVTAPRINRSAPPITDRAPPVIAAAPRVGSAPRVEPGHVAPPERAASGAADLSTPLGAKTQSNFDGEPMHLGEQALPDGFQDALRGYRVALARYAKRFRIYPPTARERGIGGRAEVELVLMVAAGPKLSIKQSSGNVALDHAALEMLQRSVDSVDLPVPLRERQIFISLPVEFVPPP